MSRFAAPRSKLKSSKSTASHPVTAKSRPRTGVPSTSHGYFNNDILCAVSEARGISPTVGLAFINLSTCEAVLCQFADTQTFARTCQKIKVFSPTDIIYASTATDSKLLSIIEENLEVRQNDVNMHKIDRRYWSEGLGQEYIQQLALPEDLQALKLSLTGNYFAVCCFAAALQFLDLGLSQTFTAQSLRIKFESSEGAMMIDLSTIASLELVQNLQNAKSTHCLYGSLNQTLTKMGARLLKNNVLQPSTDRCKIEQRWSAVSELSSKEELFFSARDALKGCVDTDRTLANLVLLPKKLSFAYMEQSVNNVLMLKSFVDCIKPIWQALVGVSSTELQNIRELCDPDKWVEVQELVDYALSPDVSYSQNATDLRNHRVFAIRAGTNGFLDVARQSYNELVGDAKALIDQLQGMLALFCWRSAKLTSIVDHELTLDLKYDTSRQFYIRALASDLESPASLPDPFINPFSKGKFVECQTLALVKLNQKIKDVHNEIVAMSDSSIQLLISSVRTKIQVLFKISEGIALLDLLTSFAHLITTDSYVRPELSTNVLAIKAARHPIREKIQQGKYIPNDVYATQAHKRFQIITGCNMSGKSTYIRCIALLTIMAQIGSFVPADYASFPIKHSLFARISTDNCMEANVSTFASEMREMAFILRNIEPRSLVIVDELGRGTSTTDGLSIAIAISEALIQSKAHVWFVTHFRDLPRILAERVGVYNLHMHVDIATDFSEMKMRYRISEGREEQKYYGLALAQIVDLPDDVMEIAVAVSRELHIRNEQKKDNAKVIALAKRRKLVVCLKETLIQARDGELQGQELLDKMRKVQEEFGVRMASIEAEYIAATEGGVGTVDNFENNVDVPPTRGSVEDKAHNPRKMENGGRWTANSWDLPHTIKTEQILSSVYTHHTSSADQKSPSVHRPQITTPQTPSETSWETSVQHENPAFRPMPTGTPLRTNARTSPPKRERSSEMKQESKSENTGRHELARLASWRRGNEMDDPIYIEDDGMSEM